ncbi:MAG: polyphosphate kinase 1 [Candidatus Omnitrophica bacterium]|nr:polyphosphate kinase 1 [Candidatus Omnitrophota bacterium]
MQDVSEWSDYRFFHRDLSWLEFNQRVLEEAVSSDNPLLERLRFCAIFSNNLDEFFMVRVAGLLRLIESKHNQKDAYGYYPQEVYQFIRQKYEHLIRKQYEIFNKHLLEQLAEQRIFIKGITELTNEEAKMVERFFETTIFPIVTPLAVDPGHPFPVLPSRTNAFAIKLQRNNDIFLAIVPLPYSLPRLLKLPSERDEYKFILIDEIIRYYLAKFFRGYTLKTVVKFRVIRDSEVLIAEDYTQDLLRAIEQEIKKRPKAKVVNLQVEIPATEDLIKDICAGLEYSYDDIVRIDGFLDLTFLFELANSVVNPKLLYKSFIPARMEYEDIFEIIKEQDFILHLPFESFQPTIDLLKIAAKDRDVLAIKMTLYRTNDDSAVIKALLEAARNKKQVTVLVELKARFEEERNIDWTKDLEAAGCHVIYGMPGYKVHAKMMLIIRKEQGRIQRYVHLSTGNYNENTTRIYTDIGYFTANEDIAREVADIFNFITGYSLPGRLQRIVYAPYELRKYIFDLINKEIAFQKKYGNGFIFAKMNALEDTQIIEKLYEAFDAGVRIQLLVRGICCLIPKQAQNHAIEVRSIVGRFLEHSRIFIFGNNNDKRVFLSSADWMTRNFDKRVELLFEVNRKPIKDKLIWIMKTYWEDTAKVRYLAIDGTYTRPEVNERKFNAQEELLKIYTT